MRIPRRRIRALTGLLLLALAVGAWVQATPARGHGSRIPVAHVAFRAVGGVAAVSDGRYSFIDRNYETGTLIDELTGHSTAVTAPAACENSEQTPTIGGPWLLWQCATLSGSWFELYSIERGVVTVLPVPAAIRGSCMADGTLGTCEPVGVGSDWIEYLSQCYHCARSYSFVNIGTDAVWTAPLQTVGIGSGRVLDLNRPSRSRPSCAAKLTPTEGVAYPTGRTALIYSPAGGGTYYTERCGRPRSRALNHYLGILGLPDAEIAVAGSLVVYVPFGARQLELVALATDSGRRIRIPISTKMASALSFPGGIALGARTIYLSNGDEVWSGRLPRSLWAASGGRTATRTQRG